MSDLPETDKIIPRPVWARLQRRQKMEPMLPPTEEEKTDAIAVMREARGYGITAAVSKQMLLEAERIFIEASA